MNKENELLTPEGALFVKYNVSETHCYNTPIIRIELYLVDKDNKEIELGRQHNALYAFNYQDIIVEYDYRNKDYRLIKQNLKDKEVFQ